MENFNGIEAWCITDGKAGNIHQAKGLAQLLDIKYELKEIKLNFPWDLLPVGFLPFSQFSFKNFREFRQSKIPKIIITCGKRSVYISIFLKKKFPNLFNIHILNPKVDNSNFNLIITPKHDNLIGDNVLSTELAINHINENFIKSEKLRFEGYFKSETRKICTVLTGGANKNYKFGNEEAKILTKKINDLNQDNNLRIIVLFSRRTPGKIKKIIKSNLLEDNIVWEKKENPYVSLLGYSDFIICTSDSVSMISESIYSKKPVFIHILPSKKNNNRIEKFVNSILNKNYAKVLENNLYDFKCEYQNENENIKKIVEYKYETFKNK